jgi:hypothetical protein
MTTPNDNLPEYEESDDQRLDITERDIEAPDDDLFEQTIPIDPADRPGEFQLGLEVDEFDAWEQSQVVQIDDDY